MKKTKFNGMAVNFPKSCTCEKIGSRKAKSLLSVSGVMDSIISDPGDEVESITARPAIQMVLNKPKYSKAFLKQMNQTSEAIGKAFKNLLEAGPHQFVPPIRRRTQKEQNELETLRRKKHINQEEYERIIQLQTKRYLNFY